jgi:hypothetical protein
MLSSPQDILHSFDILPETEQRVVALEIIRRAAQWEADQVSDEELNQQADLLFQMLDQEEESNAKPQSK